MFIGNPIRLPFRATIGGSPVTGATFPGSDVLVTVNGTAWANGAGSVFEAGKGYYSYTPAGGESGTSGFIAVRVTGPCDEFVWVESVTQLDGSISLPRRMFLRAFLGGVAVIGATFAGAGQLEVSINGGAWSPAAGFVAEIGLGYYYYQAAPSEVSAAETASEGSIEVKISGPCDEYTWRETFEFFSGSSPAPPAPPLPPSPGLSAAQPLAQQVNGGRIQVVVPTAINTLMIAAENVTENLRARQSSNLSLPSLYKRAYLVAYETDEIAVVRQ